MKFLLLQFSFSDRSNDWEKKWTKPYPRDFLLVDVIVFLQETKSKIYR